MDVLFSGWYRKGKFSFPETKPDEYEWFEIKLTKQEAHNFGLNTEMIEIILGNGDPVVIAGLEIKTELICDIENILE